jgi:hypothetical protein
MVNSLLISYSPGIFPEHPYIVHLFTGQLFNGHLVLGNYVFELRTILTQLSLDTYPTETKSTDKYISRTEYFVEQMV